MRKRRGKLDLLVTEKLKLLILLLFFLIINQEVDVDQSVQRKSPTGRVASSVGCQLHELTVVI